MNKYRIKIGRFVVYEIQADDSVTALVKLLDKLDQPPTDEVTITQI